MCRVIRQNRVHDETICRPYQTGTNIPPHTWSDHLTRKWKPSGFLKGPVTYTVTSEDKQWSRTYQVSIKKGQTTMPNEIEFEFEDAYLSKGYYNWQENWNGNKLDIWATGNSGFK